MKRMLLKASTAVVASAIAFSALTPSAEARIRHRGDAFALGAVGGLLTGAILGGGALRGSGGYYGEPYNYRFYDRPYYPSSFDPYYSSSFYEPVYDTPYARADCLDEWDCPAVYRERYRSHYSYNPSRVLRYEKTTRVIRYEDPRSLRQRAWDDFYNR